MFDTVKGGDYLTDQDAAEVLAREAVERVIELEHMGLPFNRTPDGKIDQRRFGGHTRNFGEAAGEALVLRRRPHRPHDPADAVPAVHQGRRALLRRVPRRGHPLRGWRRERGRPRGRRRRVSDRGRRDPHVPCQGRPPGHRRLRPGVADHEQRVHARRRRDGPRVPSRRPARGHGVLPVPPDGGLRDRDPPVGGGTRRGRHPAQPRRRALHGALRAQAHGAGAARHGEPRDLPGDPRRARDRREGLRLPRRQPPGPQGHRGEAAGHHGLRPDLSRRGAAARAGADPADGPLRDGRRAHGPLDARPP